MWRMFCFNKNKEKYYNQIIKENPKQLYSFESKYANQEKILFKMYGKADNLNKKIRLIVLSDTHNCLKEKEFADFVENHKEYDVCLLLGDHHPNDLNIILKYINKDKIYGLLGNHDYNYLEDFNIENINGKIINIKETTLMGIQGSFKYKPSDFPSFTQRDSILFLNNKPKVDILISHDNGFDSNMSRNPAHQGLFGITYYLFKNKIPYHIHGHIHNPYKKELVNGTKEISVHMYEYIELGYLGEDIMDKNEEKNNIDSSHEDNYLNREIIIDKVKYQYDNIDKRNNYPTINDFIINEIKIINNELLTKDGVEQVYTPCIRAKHCIDEFEYHLDNNKLEQAFYNIYEIIESDKEGIYTANYDNGYKYSAFISNEEKNILLSMIEKLTSKLNANSNSENEKKVATEQDLNEIAENICKEIEKLPIETEFTMYQFLEKYNNCFYLDDGNILSTIEKIYLKCEEKNILFDSKHPNEKTGLIWNIVFIKK